jgi:hypothetical protein
MHSYNKILSDTQMWQVTLLLANADKPLPSATLMFSSPQQPAANAPCAQARTK